MLVLHRGVLDLELVVLGSIEQSGKFKNLNIRDLTIREKIKILQTRP